MMGKTKAKELGSSKVRLKKSYERRGLKRAVREGVSMMLLKALSIVLRNNGETPEYESVDDGGKIAVDWKDTGLNLACCTCGLVHYITFEVVDKYVTMQFWRNEEETRKHRLEKGVVTYEEDQLLSESE